MKLENIKNLFENIRLGLYKSENYQIECFYVNDCAQLNIKRIDRHSEITIKLTHPKKDVYNLYYYTGKYSYTAQKHLSVNKEDYENMVSFIIECATTKDLINESIAVDAFNI